MKKRSLIVATIMLLVAVITATGTTYAWFTNTSTAKATVSMGVAAGSSLELSTDNITWTSSYTYEGNKIWKDASINANSTDFYRAAFNDIDDVTKVTGYTKVTDIASVTLHFRSTNANDVIINNGNISGEGLSPDLVKYAHILIDKGEAQIICSNSANTVNNTIVGTTINDNTGSYTTVALSTMPVVVNLSDTANSAGYYTGSATFYFFIEGTTTDNGDLIGSVNKNLTAILTFSQTEA